jgi:hypothetical protein
MSRQIFRQTALDSLATPEQLDRMVRVTSPRGWLALAGFGLIIGVALVWGIFGSLPIVVKANGILQRSGGTVALTAQGAGQLEELTLKEGQTVSEGQIVGRIRAENGEIIPLKSPVAANVLEVSAANGTQLKSGTLVATFDVPNRPLEAVIFVPVENSSRLRAGQKVQLNPLNISAAEYGYLEATVTEVAARPASPESLAGLFGSPELAAVATGNRPVMRVNVRLATTPDNKLKWSSAKRPPTEPATGLPTGATIILGEQNPLSLLLPGN